MQKQILERFISKYTLGGMIEIVPWKSNGQQVKIEVTAENRMVIAHLSCQELPLPEGEYCIYETAQLRSLLNILGDEIQIETKFVKGKPAIFTLEDGSTVINYALADPEAMPVQKRLDQSKFHEEMWNAEFEADAKFVNAFIRSKGALNLEDFSVLGSKELKVVIGHSKYANSTRVTLTPPATLRTPFDTLKFNANCLREVLVANKEAVGRVRISEEGLMHLHYDLGQTIADYYLTALVDEE